MSETNETDRINERRRNMGLPPITARAFKPTRQLTTEDIREYLEEIKAIAEKSFSNEIDRDTYIKNVRKKVKEELLAEKVQLTDDDQILILDKITGKVKTTKVSTVKSKSTSKEFFKDKSQDLSNTSPEILKLIDLIKNDKIKSNKDKILDNIRTGKNVEKLETLSTSFESLLHEQQITIKLLNELKNKIAGSSTIGGAAVSNNRNRGQGGIGSSILRGIVNNPGIAILGGIGIARVVGGITSGGEIERSSLPQAEEVIARGAGGPRVQAQNLQGELNEELRSMVREGQLTREQANNISIRTLTGEITLEEAREEVRRLVQPANEIAPSSPLSVTLPASAPSNNNVPAIAETEEQIYNRLLVETPENTRNNVDAQNDLRSEAEIISRRNRQQPASSPSAPSNSIPTLTPATPTPAVAPATAATPTRAVAPVPNATPTPAVVPATAATPTRAVAPVPNAIPTPAILAAAIVPAPATSAAVVPATPAAAIVPNAIPAAIVPTPTPAAVVPATPTRAVATPAVAPATTATPTPAVAPVPNAIPAAVVPATPAPAVVSNAIPATPTPAVVPAPATSAAVVPATSAAVVPATSAAVVPTPAVVPAPSAPQSAPNAIPAPQSAPNAIPTPAILAAAIVPNAIPAAIVPTPTPAAVVPATPTRAVATPQSVPNAIPNAIPAAVPNAAPATPTPAVAPVPNAIPATPTPAVVPAPATSAAIVPNVIPAAIVPNAIPAVATSAAVVSNAIPAAVPATSAPQSAPNAIPAVVPATSAPQSAPNAIPAAVPNAAPATPTPAVAPVPNAIPAPQSVPYATPATPAVVPATPTPAVVPNAIPAAVVPNAIAPQSVLNAIPAPAIPAAAIVPNAIPAAIPTPTPTAATPAIPTAATPVRLNGQLVGYMPEGGGPTITFNDAGRQELESARLRVVSETPPLAASEAPTVRQMGLAGTRSIAMATNPVATPQVQTTTPSVDAAIVPIETAATPSSIKTLEASNISRREYFDQTDNNATIADESELADNNGSIIAPAAKLTNSNLILANILRNISDTNTQPISSAKDSVTPNVATKNLNALKRNIAKDDDVVVNEAVREAELLAIEYESNPDLFSNRNLVLRARKVTFSGDSIEFKLPSIDATSSNSASSGAPNPFNIFVSMPAPVPAGQMPLPAGQAIAREPAMPTTPAAVTAGAAASAVSSTGLIRPTSGRVTSPFGMRSMGMHKGIDYGVPIGTPVVAAHSGTIVEVRESSSYGNMIRIRGDNGMDTLYAHLSTFGVQQGQQVAAGQQIALSGNTGRSTGPHLHFEVIRNGTRIDPAPLLGLSSAEATQRSEGQTPEPSPSESDATPVAATPATATASTTPSVETMTPTAQMLSAPASDGAAVDGASRDNAMAERSPVPASAPNVIDMSGGSGNPSVPPPSYNSSDPNDPGLVEPEDAAERYAKLFDMAA